MTNRPRLRNSLVANYAGQIWVALMGIAFVPVYLRMLGAEQFGLVSFMLSLQAISLLLDLGIGVFLSRELALRAHGMVRRDSMRSLIRTFEWLIWPTAVAIALAIFLAADTIAFHWLNPQNLGRSETVSAVYLIAVVVALLWPTSFYAAGLSGLEQQPRLNILVATFATLRFAGVVPVMYYTGGGLQAFLLWHAVVAGAQTACSAVLMWRLLPPSKGPPRFDRAEIVGARRFALGVFAITGLGLLLSQMDRLALSALRPLQELGYYAVAVTVSAGLGRLVQPVFNAVYPKLSQFAASGDQIRLSDLYHLSSQIVVIVVGPLAAVICIYSEEVLWLWTGDPAIAARVALPLTLLFAGTAINGVLNLPYALQLAHGWTRLAMLSNLVALIVIIPMYVFAISRFGVAGAASIWLAMNLLKLLIGVPLMHRRLLRGELRRWYLFGVLGPAAASVTVVLLAKWIGPQVDRSPAGLAWLGFVGFLALLAALLAGRESREALALQVKSLRE